MFLLLFVSKTDDMSHWFLKYNQERRYEFREQQEFHEDNSITEWVRGHSLLIFFGIL